MPQVTTLLFFVWAAAILVAVWSLRVAQVFAKRMPRLVAQPLEKAHVRVAVILPIKGIEKDTAENIQALLDQDYPNYRLIFAVEHEDDPAVALIERLAESQPAGKIEIVTAGLSDHRGQKVHNQLAAVEHTDDLDEILMFVDADARPGRRWIHSLVIPLTYGPHIGATTGYRYYVPAAPTAANAFASLLNAGVATLFGPYRRTFAWGGSMAIRRQDFFEYGVHSAWQNALSDDFVLAHCVKGQAQKKIHFVPYCLVASDANFSWSSFFEFAIRQYRITRICAPHIWLPAIIGPILYLTSFFYTLIFCIRAAIWPPAETPHEALRLGTMFLALYLLTIIRGLFVLRGARTLLPQHAAAIQRTRFWFTFGYPIVQAANLLALLASAVGRTIIWRGVTYTMHTRTKTTVRRSVTETPLRRPQPAMAEAAPES